MDMFIFFIMMCHRYKNMSKLIKVYTLNVCSLLCVNCALTNVKKINNRIKEPELD